jgi:hypothetical protein
MEGYFIIIISGVTLSPLGTAATTDLWYQPQMIHDGDCVAIGGMTIGRETRSTQKTCPSASLSSINPTRPGLELAPPQWEARD